MPIEVALWRLGDQPSRVPFSGVDTELKLEQVLSQDISLVDPTLLLIGRQVPTAFGKYIDLLAMDADGNLVVMELKRNRTPREVVAQLLDYGCWIRTLEVEDIMAVFQAYQSKYNPENGDLSLDQVFTAKFDVAEMPETLNESHELMIVASELDDSTERIITYLSEEYGVAINAVFFRYFKDGDREYLSRAWLIPPETVEAKKEEKREQVPWNGEYYVSFGHHEGTDGRRWEDAQRYGFFSAGGGEWYTRTLKILEPGARIWVNIPGHGYVGVGVVEEGPMAPGDFLVTDDKGKRVPITTMPLVGRVKHPSQSELDEYLVRVRWLKTIPVEEAIREKGFFGNQNSAAKPRNKKWIHTIDRLKSKFGILDGSAAAPSIC
jgi:hypothetical protein